MHQVSGKSMVGFMLALTTAVLWGILPIALKLLLDIIDAVTITGIRFIAAAAIVGIWLLCTGKLPALSLLKNTRIAWLMAIAIAGLLGNYVFYLSGLDYLNAEAGQMLIQLAPFLMMIGGIFIFKEKLLLWQKAGAVILVSGLILFFNDKLSLFAEGGKESWGILLVVIASVTWAAYALAQKQLLMHYNSKQIMYLIYVAGAVSLLPVADFAPLTQQSMTPFYWGLLIFCCINTVIAYGSFAEALHHWEASKVSAVLAITPLLTIFFAGIINGITPGLLEVQSLNIWSWFGAALVVAGSALTALAPQFVEYRAARRAKQLQRDVF